MGKKMWDINLSSLGMNCIAHLLSLELGLELSLECRSEASSETH